MALKVETKIFSRMETNYNEERKSFLWLGKENRNACFAPSSKA